MNTTARTALFYRRFADVEAVSQGLPGWDIEYRQLDASMDDSEIVYVAGASITFTAARFGPMVEHQGCTPLGSTVFTFGPGNAGVGRWQGMTVSREYVALSGPGCEFEAVTPARLSLSNLIVPDDIWESACSNWAPTDPSRLLASGNGLNISPKALHRLRQWNDQVILDAKQASPDVDNLTRHIEDYGPALLIGALFEGRAAPSRPSCASRYRALRRAREYIEEKLPGDVRVSDLVQDSGVSERTVEYVFREHYALTPQAYISARRLHLARRRLLRGDRDSTTIAAVAMDCGFPHFGRFSLRYKAMYGESPSATLKGWQRTG